jgi:hypothetical protein
MTEAGGATLTDNQGEPTTLAPRTRGPSRVFAVLIFAMLPAQLASATNKTQRCCRRTRTRSAQRMRNGTAGGGSGPPRRPLPRIPSSRRRGEQCAGGQSGKVWYLAGTVGSGSVTRTCTVPTGRALFFPITGDVAEVLGQEQPPKPPQSPAVQGSLVVKSGDPPFPPR